MIVLEVSARELRAGDLRFPGRVTQFGRIRQSLSVLDSVESGHASVTLDNGDGELSRVLHAGRLIGETAVVLDGDDELFRGAIASHSDGATISIDLEAGGLYRLFEPLPLRRASVWGDYRRDAVIPLVYGRARVEPIEYGDDRRRWVVADGSTTAIARAGAVRRDGAPTDDYRPDVTIDATGRAVSMVVLGADLVEGEPLSVEARGFPDGASLIDDAAGIVEHMMTEIVGAPVSGLGRFRRETAGIEVGGAFVEGAQTVQGALDEIVGSVGGVWSDGMPGFARLYPAARGSNEPIRQTFTPATAVGLSASVDLSAIVTALRIRYAYDYAEREPGGVVELTAAVNRFGRRERVVDWPFARLASDVVRNGTRVLEHMARPVARVRFTANSRETALLRLGDWIMVDDARTVVDGLELFVTGREYDPLTGEQAIVAIAPLGAAPAVTLAGLTSLLPPPLIGVATLISQGSVAQFTLRDPASGRPIAGATLTMDGGARRVTDGRGAAQFADVAPGAHTVIAEHSSFGSLRHDWIQGAA